jgi:hypothetical protein
MNALYKTEVVHRHGPWRSFEAVEFATLEWVDWFYNRRLLAPTGSHSGANGWGVRAGLAYPIGD